MIATVPDTCRGGTANMSRNKVLVVDDVSGVRFGTSRLSSNNKVTKYEEQRKAAQELPNTYFAHPDRTIVNLPDLHVLPDGTALDLLTAFERD
jgi:hypothetical protein